MTSKTDIAQQIRDARIDSGLTQDELAGHLRVSRQMVGRYEAGTDEPSVAVIARAASILGVSFEIDGIRIMCEPVDPRVKPQVAQRQLRFDFGKAQRFPGAVVEIIPYKGKLLIRAELPSLLSKAKAK